MKVAKICPQRQYLLFNSRTNGKSQFLRKIPHLKNDSNKKVLYIIITDQC